VARGFPFVHRRRWARVIPPGIIAVPSWYEGCFWMVDIGTFTYSIGLERIEDIARWARLNGVEVARAMRAPSVAYPLNPWPMLEELDARGALSEAPPWFDMRPVLALRALREGGAGLTSAVETHRA